MTQENNFEQADATARMVENYLRRRALAVPAIFAGDHLDEDVCSAFVEGRLSESECSPVTSHLIDCGMCLRKTAQLIRLAAAMDEIESLSDVQDASPQPHGALRRLLDGIARGARSMLDISESQSVLAYQAPPEPAQQADDKTSEKNTSGETEEPKS